MASLEVAGTALSVLNGVFHVALDISRLQDVDKDLRICLDFLVVVDCDLNRARELRTDKFAEMNSEVASSDRSYIDGIIERMEKGVLEIGQIIVAYHIASEINDSIPISLRFRWVMKGKELFRVRQVYFNTAHASLLGVISKMETMTRPAASPSYVEVIESGDSQTLRSPSKQRALRGKSSMILGQSHIETIQLGDSHILRSPSQKHALQGKTLSFLKS
ncbi:uncharacterized protein EAF02_000137 [Botrytis sinoallii]|uniref:uncharacterized protein n=1 Tax=Botrytis sinoallii TaxID=1463999 RepID=UPI0018FF6A8B|nr:uncharacterized protein EAF02_000137 [Botrytis sinoallii]KAF7892599.1 hypothetical protein EAF02_000137 [Botrytis sinoallii]